MSSFNPSETHFRSSAVAFHSPTIKAPFALFPDEPYIQFGTLQLDVAKVDITSAPLFIFFTVDASDSMRSSFKPKIDYVISTLSNIIRYLAQLSEVKIYIQVDTFNTRIKTVVNVVRISMDNAEELCAIIKEIKVKDQTNIELALENAKFIMEDYSKNNPEHNIHHVFLTDGDANMGNMDPKYLSHIIQSTNTSSNVFIGVGDDHNAKMLQEFGMCPQSDYRFIDNSENTGIIYGEVMERILRPAMKNVIISIVGGELFDWTNNLWTTSLVEWTIDSESSKTYHIRRVVISNETDTMRTEPVEVLIRGKARSNEIMVDIEHVVRESDDDVNGSTVDLSRYMFRHRVLRLLFECRAFEYRRSKPLKKQIAEAFREQRIYMRENRLMTDVFMRTLCEDLVVAYRSIGTNYAQMYCASRESSQAKQEAFTPKIATKDPDHIDKHVRFHNNKKSKVVNHGRMRSPPPLMVRMSSVWHDEESQGPENEFYDEYQLNQTINAEPDYASSRGDLALEPIDEDHIDNYIMDTTVDMNEFAYTTPTRLTSIRMCSEPMDVDSP